jgi:hypothetical protein
MYDNYYFQELLKSRKMDCKVIDFKGILSGFKNISKFENYSNFGNYQARAPIGRSQKSLEQVNIIFP